MMRALAPFPSATVLSLLLLDSSTFCSDCMRPTRLRKGFTCSAHFARRMNNDTNCIIPDKT